MPASSRASGCCGATIDEWRAALALYEPHDTLMPDAAARAEARDARARAGLPFDTAGVRDSLTGPSSPEAAWLTIHEPAVIERWGWQLVDLIPRRELFNAPPLARGAGTPAPRVGVRDADHLPVPIGWPRRPWTWWPVNGIREPDMARRHGLVSVHRSVEPFIRAGRYRIEPVAFVDDQALPLDRPSAAR